MVKPTPEGHRPKRERCGQCPDCRSIHTEPQAWWVSCGGVFALIWAVCPNAARLELLRIMRLRSVGNGWGTTHNPIPATYIDDENDRLVTRPPGEVIEEELTEAGITARPATEDDQERWAQLVRQNQGLEALEAD